MATNIAIAGLGPAGRRHAEVLATLDGVRVVAVADPDRALGAAVGALLDARSYPHWEPMLAAERELDALVLATPPGERRDAIEEVCDRELALFCETPFAADLATAERCARTVRRSGIPAAVGFQHRWSLLAAHFRELIRHQPRSFARILMAAPLAEWTAHGTLAPDLCRPERRGGPALELGIHLLDALRYVTRDEPVLVQGLPAEAGESGTEGVPAAAAGAGALLLGHESGMLTTYVHDFTQRRPRFEIQVAGPAFDLTWDLGTPERLHGYADCAAVDETGGTDLFVEQMRGFVEALRRKQPSLLHSDPADACRSLAAGLAGVEALASGRAVPVPEAPTRPGHR